MQLFDLDMDPAEQSNLAFVYPDVVKSLMTRIAWARNELGDIDTVGKGARFFDKGERQLQYPLKSK